MYDGPSIYPMAIGGACIYFFTIFISIFPLMWHIRSGNASAALVVFWMVISNLFYFINAFIWRNDDLENWYMGYGYCDIAIRINIAAVVGLPAALLCLLYNLARMFNPKKTVVAPTPQEKKRETLCILGLCVAFPLLVSGLAYLVQPTRYIILGISGCYWNNAPTWLTWPIFQFWPFLFSTLGMFYALLVSFRVYRYRREFPNLVRMSRMTKSSFIRLYLLGLIPALAVFPVQILIMYNRFAFFYKPYSFNNVHKNFSTIILVPSHGKIPWDHYISPISLTIAFFLFGTGREARVVYTEWLTKMGAPKVLPDRFWKWLTTPSPKSNETGQSAAGRLFSIFSHKSRGSTSSGPSSDLEKGDTTTVSNFTNPFDPSSPVDRPAIPGLVAPVNPAINGVGQVLPSVRTFKSSGRSGSGPDDLPDFAIFASEETIKMSSAPVSLSSSNPGAGLSASSNNPDDNSETLSSPTQPLAAAAAAAAAFFSPPVPKLKVKTSEGDVEEKR